MTLSSDESEFVRLGVVTAPMDALKKAGFAYLQFGATTRFPLLDPVGEPSYGLFSGRPR